MNQRSQSAMPRVPVRDDTQDKKPPTHGPSGEWGSVPQKTYQPFGCFVAVHALREKATPSGLVMPDGSSVGGTGIMETERCLVIACGPKCEQLKEGDVILIHQQIPMAVVVHKGNRTLIMREESAGGVVKTEEQFQEMEREAQGDCEQPS